MILAVLVSANVEVIPKKGARKGRRPFENFPMLGPCKCKLDCAINLSEDDRIANHANYWALKNTTGRISFITIHVKKVPVKRRRSRNRGTATPQKQYSKICELMKKIGENAYERVQVCRTFFLHTFGYKSSNGNVIEKALNHMNPITYKPKDKKPSIGRLRDSVLQHEEAIKAHVESFHPETSHYRYVHAPNRRYLPDTFSIVGLWEHFKSTQEKYADIDYELYRREFKKLNITICKLGHEE